MPSSFKYLSSFTGRVSTRSTFWSTEFNLTTAGGTSLPPNQTSGAEEVEFKELYSQVAATAGKDYRHECGIEPIEAELRRKDKVEI